jgi:hypothetical protein
MVLSLQPLFNSIANYTSRFMTTVKLNSTIENGSVVFRVSELKQVSMYFSQSQVKKQLKGLYKERYQLNSWRTFDKSVMEKEFGK